MTQPLSGKRIVNTRAMHQAAALDDLIRARGGQPLAYPCLEIVPPENTDDLDLALWGLNQQAYDWLVLTSANVVLTLAQRFEKLGLAAERFNGLKVAAVGPSTAELAQAQLGVEIDLMPEKYVAESLADALAGENGSRILLPQSEIARPVLAEQLTETGAKVTQVTAYRSVIGRGGANIPALLILKKVDAITFTSPSTARHFTERLAAEGGCPEHLDGVCIAAIGPVTTKAAQELGLRVAVTPEEHTLSGMLDTLEQHYQ